MDLLPDLNDLNIVPLDEIDAEIKIEKDIVVDTPINLHEDIFIEKDKPKQTKKEQLDGIRAKSIIARHGTKEQRIEKKRLKELEKAEKKLERDRKREFKKEENRRKARERYWNNKYKEEKEEKDEPPPPPKITPSPSPVINPPILNNTFSQDQFNKYMNDYHKNKPPTEPKIIYKEVVKEVIREVEKPKAVPLYPSIFSHIDF